MFLRIVNSWYCETFLIPNESAFICKEQIVFSLFSVSNNNNNIIKAATIGRNRHFYILAFPVLCQSISLSINYIGFQSSQVSCKATVHKLRAKAYFV